VLSLYFKNLVNQKPRLNKFTDVLDICHLLQFGYFLFYCTEVFKKQLMRQILTDSEKMVNLSIPRPWKHTATEQVQFLSNSMPALDGVVSFTPWQIYLIYWIPKPIEWEDAWVIVSLGVVGKRKIYCIYRVLNSKSSRPQSSHYTVWAIRIYWFRNLIIF